MKWPSRARIYHLSRDSGFLWKVVIGILGVCTLLGAVAGQFGRRDVSAFLPTVLEKVQTDSPEEVTLEIIRVAPLPIVLNLVADLPEKVSQPDVERAIAESGLKAEERELAMEVARSFFGGKPTDALERMASEQPPRRYANQMVGQLLKESDAARAAAAYEVEGRTFQEAETARAMAIELYRDMGRDADVSRLMEDPAFRDEISTGTALRIAWARGEWWRFPLILLEREWHDRSPLAILMVGVSGMVWLSIGLHLAQAPLFSMRAFICLLSAVLGYFSGVGVLIAGFVKEDLHGFAEGKTFVENLVYYVIGVGVPEETFKLLFFIPLVPWLVARKEPVEMLMAAAFAGLGFAIGENLNYVEGHGTATAITRFLTANFLHMALTGIVGGAFCQMFYYRRGLEKFLGNFIVAILLHGAYDAVWILVEGSFLAMMLLIGAGYLFFHQLRADRPLTREPISPVASFAVGSAVVIGVAIVIACYQMGFSLGLSSVGSAALSFALLNVMFVRELGRV